MFKHENMSMKIYHLIPNFYMAKLGSTGVYIFFFLIFDPKHRDVSTKYFIYAFIICFFVRSRSVAAEEERKDWQTTRYKYV